MIVLDASAVFEVLIGSERGASILDRIQREEGYSLAPHLIDLEVAQSLRRYARAEQITEERASAALADLAGLPLQREPHDVFLSRIWSLRHNAGAYDAAYLALAEAYEATLITCDQKMARVPGVAAEVEVF